MLSTEHPISRLNLARTLWGWIPHPTQREWFLCPARTKIAACGRRWGKTEAAAIDAATMAICRPGCTQMIVAPSYDQARLIFDHVERLLTFGSAAEHTKVLRTPYPRLTVLGSLIAARTADEDGRNLRGNSADRVIVDEAAYVRESVINEVISPMLADRAGKLVMISTPFGKNHFYRSFVRGQDCGERYASFTFPSWVNPHISAEYIEEQREVLTPRQFAVEYEAQFIDNQSTVFAWDEIELALDKPPPDGFGCVVAGIDWARYSDYTAVVAVGVDEDGIAVVGIDHFNRINWDLQMDRIIEFFKAHNVCAALTDATGMGDPLLERLRTRAFERSFDVALEGMTFTAPSKRELIDNLVMQFARGAIALPHDERLLRELQFYEYELTPAGGVKMNAPSGCHDDLVIALALACGQAKQMGTVGGYRTAGARASSRPAW